MSRRMESGARATVSAVGSGRPMASRAQRRATRSASSGEARAKDVTNCFDFVHCHRSSSGCEKIASHTATPDTGRGRAPRREYAARHHVAYGAGPTVAAPVRGRTRHGAACAWLRWIRHDGVSCTRMPLGHVRRTMSDGPCRPSEARHRSRRTVGTWRSRIGDETTDRHHDGEAFGQRRVRRLPQDCCNPSPSNWRPGEDIFGDKTIRKTVPTH